MRRCNISKFKVGDRVRIVVENSGRWPETIGREVTIASLQGESHYSLDELPSGVQLSNWSEDEFELINKKGSKMSDKMYRVKKDTPQWEEGAIVKKDNDGDYSAISNLWDTPATQKMDHYVETEKIIENSPGWYERVYEVSVLGKAKYLTKEAAKKAHNSLYKEK